MSGIPMSFSQASEQLADADQAVDLARKQLARCPCDHCRTKYNETMTAYEQAYADYSLACRTAAQKALPNFIDSQAKT